MKSGTRTVVIWLLLGSLWGCSDPKGGMIVNLDGGSQEVPTGSILSEQDVPIEPCSIVPDRTIRCTVGTPGEMEGDLVKLADLESGETIVRVASGEPCSYYLALQSADGSVEPIFKKPGPFYFAHGLVDEGRLLVAFTVIEHGDWAAESSSRLTSTISGIKVLGTVRENGRWSDQQTLVDLEDQAAYLVELGKPDGVLKIRYLQDSLFIHTLFSQECRPDSDGLYQADLVLSDGKLAVRDPARIQDYQLPTPE